jgi:hypothetical protein
MKESLDVFDGSGFMRIVGKDFGGYGGQMHSEKYFEQWKADLDWYKKANDEVTESMRNLNLVLFGSAGVALAFLMFSGLETELGSAVAKSLMIGAVPVLAVIIRAVFKLEDNKKRYEAARMLAELGE